MARIRNIKPAFFKDSELFDAEKASGLPLRVAYAGLWTVADRAGRFKWKPREIKTDVLPYDDVDMEAVLNGLVNANKIFRYQSGGFEYGFVRNFEKHQFINKNEVTSQLPDPPTNILEYSKTFSHCETTGSLDTDTDGLTQTAKGAATPPPPKPVRKSSTTIPDHFPGPSELAAACGYWLDKGRDDLDATDEAARFVAHHRAHGKRMADWGQAWVTWYSNAIKFNKRPANGQGNRTAHDKFFAGAAAYIEDACDYGDGASGEGDGRVVALQTRRALLPP